MSAALPLLLALALQASPQALDLQVEARACDGAAAPQLARSVSRALVALGARVVFGASVDEPCGRCVLLTIFEERPGRYRLEARQPGGSSSAILEVDPTATELERARAIAIQARLFGGVEGASFEEPSPPAVAARPAAARPANAVPATPRVSPPKPLLPEIVEAPPPAEPAPLESPLAIVATASPVGTEAPAQPVVVAVVAEPVPALRVPIVPRAPAPSAELAESSGVGPWPWVAGLTGIGAGLAAGGCAVAARGHLEALSDRSIPLQEAVSHRDDGERLQTASTILSAVALGGLAVGAVLLFGSSDSDSEPVSVGLAPVAGGGVLFGVSGSLP